MSARRSKNRITETQNAVHPGMRTLNDPLNLSRAAAAWFPASGNTGRNAARVPDAPVLVATVASIRVDALRPAERPTANAVDWLNRLDDGNPLRNVAAVGASQDCRDRRTVGFGGCASAAGPAAKLPTIRTCPARGDICKRYAPDGATASRSCSANRLTRIIFTSSCLRRQRHHARVRAVFRGALYIRRCTKPGVIHKPETKWLIET